jgi:hypothetical protein
MNQETQTPDTTVLELRANQAREQLLASLARLDQRAKNIAQTAAETGTASALCMAAGVTLWLSTSVLRRPNSHLPPSQRTSMTSVILRAAVATAGVVAAGMLLRAAERRVHARPLPALPSST